MSTPHYLLTNVLVRRSNTQTLLSTPVREQSSCAFLRKCSLGHSSLQIRVNPVTLQFFHLGHFRFPLSQRISNGAVQVSLSLWCPVCEEGQWCWAEERWNVCAPRWSVFGSGVWLGPTRWRRLCCILRARRHMVSRQCGSADEFWDSPDGSRPWRSLRTENRKQTFLTSLSNRTTILCRSDPDK